MALSSGPVCILPHCLLYISELLPSHFPRSNFEYLKNFLLAPLSYPFHHAYLLPQAKIKSQTGLHFMKSTFSKCEKPLKFQKMRKKSLVRDLEPYGPREDIGGLKRGTTMWGCRATFRAGIHYFNNANPPCFITHCGLISEASSSPPPPPPRTGITNMIMQGFGKGYLLVILKKKKDNKDMLYKKRIT